MLGQIDNTGGGQVADASDDGDAAGSRLDALLEDGLALVDGQGGKLSGAAARDQAVDAGVNLTLDVDVEGREVNGPIGSEWGDEGDKDAGEFLLGGHFEVFKKR
jgi:hypothetical protein